MTGESFSVRRALGILLLTGTALLGGVLAGCGASETTKVAVVLPLSGENALYGEPVKNGIEIAFDELKASGKIGANVELLIADSASDPEKAAAELDRLYQQDAPIAIGGVTSAEALLMVDVADKRDRVLLSPTASSPSLTELSKNFFRVFPSDFLEGTGMANFATQKLDLDSVVIMAAESVYGRGIQAVFKSEFERYGGKVLEVIEYPTNTNDFSGLLDRVMTLSPAAVYLADFAGPIGGMVKSLRERRFKGEILTTSAFAAPEVLSAVGEAGNGVYLTQPVFDVESDNPAVVSFVTEYERRYGEKPGLFAAHGYDAMGVAAQALANAGRPTPSELWKGMRATRDYPGVTGTIQFNEAGDVQKYPRVYILQAGKLVDYDRYVEARRRAILEQLNKLRQATEG